MVIRPYLIAVCAVLPLLAPEVWSGFRLGQSEPVLSVMAPTEQPLSVRSPGGMWAMILVLAWFGLALRQGRVSAWEAVLVLVGGTAALVRLGNAWLLAAAMVLPLGRQIAFARPGLAILAGVTAASLGVATFTLLSTRPPEFPSAASRVAQTASRERAFADWRWAGELQRQLGKSAQVLAAGGLASESSDFWLDYLRISQGHERWAEALRRLDVELVVLDAVGQQRQAADLVRSSNDWRVLYDADGALVATRAGP